MPRIDPHIDRRAASQYRRAIPGIVNRRIGREPLGVVHRHYGVAGNTFRAFTGYRRSPSQVYRAWAQRQCKRLLGGRLTVAFKSQDAFDVWHRALADSLQRQWRSAQRKDLRIAHKYKLVDLFLKWVAEHSLPGGKVPRGILKYGHCALDRQTLRALNRHLSLALPMRSETMGLIVSEHTYRWCQAILREYCNRVGGSPLLFDFYVWQRGG